MCVLFIIVYITVSINPFNHKSFSQSNVGSNANVWVMPIKLMVKLTRVISMAKENVAEEPTVHCKSYPLRYGCIELLCLHDFYLD